MVSFSARGHANTHRATPAGITKVLPERLIRRAQESKRFRGEGPRTCQSESARERSRRILRRRGSHLSSRIYGGSQELPEDSSGEDSEAERACGREKEVKSARLLLLLLLLVVAKSGVYRPYGVVFLPRSRNEEMAPASPAGGRARHTGNSLASRVCASNSAWH